MDQQVVGASIARRAAPTARFVAVIVGVSAREFFLKNGQIVTERKQAQVFRSERGAAHAADQHIKSFAPCVARQMAYRVEPKA